MRRYFDLGRSPEPRNTTKQHHAPEYYSKDGKGLKPIYFDVASVVSQFAPIHRGRTGRCAGSVNAAAPENVKPGINLAFPMACILSPRSEMSLRIAPPQ